MDLSTGLGEPIDGKMCEILNLGQEMELNISWY